MSVPKAPVPKKKAAPAALKRQWLDGVSARVEELLRPLRGDSEDPRDPGREGEPEGRAAPGVFRPPSQTAAASHAVAPQPDSSSSSSSAGHEMQLAGNAADTQQEQSLQLLQPPPLQQAESPLLRPEHAARGEVVLARVNENQELLPWLHRWPPQPCEQRLRAVKIALGDMMVDTVGEYVFDSKGYLVAYRWPLKQARPLQEPPYAGPFDNLLTEDAEGIQGPQRFHWFHGTQISRLSSIARDGALRGIAASEGGAGQNYIFARGWSGVWCSMRAAAFIKECFSSSKAPQGVVLGCKGFCRYLPLWSGGHARESQVAQPGLAVHNKRSRQWVIEEGGVELVDVYIVVN